MKLVALQSQQKLRDLHRLGTWKGGVEWLGVDDLGRSSHPAVISGMWLQDEPEESKKVLARRTENRVTTVIVPRLPNLDFQGHLGAPVTIRLKLQDYDRVRLGERDFEVPGHSVMDSPLSKGRWGETAAGSAILAWRPHHDAGWIIFSTASVASRAFGVDEEEQLELLQAILDKAGAGAMPVSEVAPAAGTETPADLDTLLNQRAETAPLLLAILAADGSHDPTALTEAAARLGLSLNGAVDCGMIPESSVSEIESALKRHGWGAYVRRLRQITQSMESERHAIL